MPRANTAETMAKPEAWRSRPGPRPKTVPGRAAAGMAAPRLSKDELRAQVEKLTRANANLRAKGRELSQAAKTAAARIAELEAQVARLQEAASPPIPARRGRKPRRAYDVDPGDAVPPGVAVEQPAPLDEEAETALENLDKHLGAE